MTAADMHAVNEGIGHLYVTVESLKSDDLILAATGVDEVLRTAIASVDENLDFYARIINGRFGVHVLVSGDDDTASFGFMPDKEYEALFSDEERYEYKNSELKSSWVRPDGSGVAYIRTNGGIVNLFLRLLFVELSKTAKVIFSDDTKGNDNFFKSESGSQHLSLKICVEELPWHRHVRLVEALKAQGAFGEDPRFWSNLRAWKEANNVPDFSF